MTPPPADPAPLPEPVAVRYPHDTCGGTRNGWDYKGDWRRPGESKLQDLVTLEQAETYGDSRERAGLARGVAEERARVVAHARERAQWAEGDEGTTSGALRYLADAIERGDHERTPDA